MSKSSIVSNMALSAICKPLSMIISYIYVPIVLNYLGVEKYGVWSTILIILSWISYFDIGIGNGLRNRLTESLNGRDGLSRKLVSSAYAFIAVIMIAVAIVFSAVASFVDWKSVFGVSDINENLASVVIISVTFVAVNFILCISNNVLYALQRAGDVSIIGLIVQVVNLFGVLIATALFGSSLFVMAMVYGLSMVSVHLVANIVIYYKNEDVRPSFRSIDINTGKSLTCLGLQFFIIQICALVLFSTDSLIISHLFGAADVTPYNTVNKLFNLINSVYFALLAPIWSAVTKAKAEKDYTTIKKTINNLYLLIIPFVVAAILLALVFEPISILWLRRKLDYGNYMIIFGALYCIINIWTNTHGTIANGLEILKDQMVMAIIQAVVNIPLSVFFARHMNLGPAGVLLGTNISLLISSIWLPILIHKKLTKR